MKRTTTLIIALLLVLNGQAQKWEWVKHFAQTPKSAFANSNSRLNIMTIRISSDGNLLVGGYFSNNFTYGSLTLTTVEDSPDAFILKLSPAGDVIWSRQFGAEQRQILDNMILDSQDNLYIALRYANATDDLDLGAGYKVKTIGGFDAALVKLNSQGETLWAKAVITGNATTPYANTERILGLALNEDESVLYIAGGGQSQNFNVGETTLTKETADKGFDQCIAAINPSDGTCNWVKHYPTTGQNTKIQEMVHSNGYLYAAGTFGGTFKVDGSIYTANGPGDLVQMKINTSTKQAEWVAVGGSTNDDLLYSVAVKDNFIYSIGYIQGNGTIDSVATEPKIQSSAFNTTNGLKMFLTKYNTEGRLIWKKVMDGSGGNGFNLNIKENILVATGYFSGSLQFNLNTITSGGGSDAAYFVFDTDGNPILGNSVVGTGTAEDVGSAIFIDDNYNFIMGGMFNSSMVTFKNGSSTLATLTNSAINSPDGFLAKVAHAFTPTFTHKKNVTCNGGNDGELTVTPYFGLSPYTYKWYQNGTEMTGKTDSSITGLVAGVYKVDVTCANAITKTLTYTVTQPSAINIATTATNVTCYGGNNGAIAITTTGGSGGFTYFWTTSNGQEMNATLEDQTGLIAGAYTVTATDKRGCIQSKTITIAQGSEITIAGTITHITNITPSGAIDITPNGGSGTYSSYAWTGPDSYASNDQDITNLSNLGNYTVTVTDNVGCSSAAIFTLDNETVFHANLVSKTNVNCKGEVTGALQIAHTSANGSVNVTWTKNGNPYSYTGDGLTLSNLGAGSYQATLIDQTPTTITITVNIAEPATALTSTITPTNTTCFNSNNGNIVVNPSGGTSPYTYSWSNSATTKNISNLAPSTYTVTITDSKGCTATNDATIAQPDDITYTIASSSPKCYGQSNGELEIKNLAGGNGGYNYLWSNTSTAIKITNLKAGSYWAKVTDSKGCYKQIPKILTQPSLLSITESLTHPTCPESTNGVIDITASGGTVSGEYNYTWTGIGVSPSAEDQGALSAGNYSVTVRDDNLCSLSKTFTLTNTNSSPTATINADKVTICEGENVTFTGTGGYQYRFLVNGNEAVALSTTNTFSTTSLNNNDKVKVYVESNAGCGATSSEITMTVNALPAPSITGTLSFCQGGSTTLDAGSFSSYKWYKDNAEISGQTSQTLNVNAAGLYKVEVTNSNGCKGTSSEVSVAENPLPAPTITGTLSFCQGGSTTLDAGSFSSYKWYKDNAEISGQTSQTLNVNAAGSYKVEVTNGNGCSATSAAVSVAENPLPAPTITGTLSFCQGGSTTLDAGSFSSYKWYKDNAEMSGQTSQTLNVNAAGSYKVEVTNGSGCSATSAAASVAENPLPAPTITGTLSFCQGGSTTLDAGSFSSYKWYKDNAEMSGQTSQTLNVNAAGSYKVEVTNGSGCSATSAAVSVAENPLPAPTITGTLSFCQGGSTTLDAGSFSSYKWYKDNAEISGQTSQTLNVNAAGSYKVEVTNGSGCSATSAAASVAENPLPAAAITTTDRTSWCVGETISVAMTASPAGTYQWMKGGADIPGATSAAYTATVAGSYAVVVTAGGCSATSNAITIGMLPTPYVSISAHPGLSICQGESVTLTAGGNATTYTWSDGISNGVAFTPTSTHTYTVTGSNGGCTTTEYVKVTVKNLPIATITTTNPTAWCEGTPISTTLTASNAGGYQWYLNGTEIGGATGKNYTATAVGDYTVKLTTSGCNAVSSPTTISTLALPTVAIDAPITAVCKGNPVTLTGTGATTYTWDNNVTNGVAFTPTSTQTYTVTGTDDNSCSNTAQIQVVVNEFPVGTISTTTPTKWCTGQPINVNFAINGTADTYQWFHNGTAIAGATATSHTDTLSGKYHALLTSNGCSASTDTITISTMALPTVAIDAPVTAVCKGNPVTLTGTGATTYAWDNGVINSAAFIPTSTQTYTVTGTDANGCSNTAQIEIVVNEYPVGTISTTTPIKWCEGQPINVNFAINGAADTYQWFHNGTAIAGAATANHTDTLAGKYHALLTSNGCSASTDTITISTMALPTVAIDAPVTAVCPGSPVTLTGTGASTYTWNNNVTNGEAFTPTSTQTYTVTGTDANGCSNTAQVEIVVHATAPVALTADKTAWCENETISSTISASAADQYQWFNESNSIDGATGQTYTATAAGKYSARLTLNGCITFSDTIEIVINPLPTVEIVASSTAITEGEDVTLTGTGAENYLWDNNVTDGVAFTPNSTQTYTVIGTDANGCSNTAQIEIVVNPSIIVTITTADSLKWCYGSPISVTMSTSTTADTYTYQWHLNGVVIDNATQPTYTATEVGLYHLAITVANNQVLSNTIEVVTRALPTVGISASNTAVCLGGGVTLQGTGANTYVWNNNIVDNVQFEPTTTTTYLVTGTDVYGCSNIDSIIITVNGVHATIISDVPANFCGGTPVNANLSVTQADTYQWLHNGTAIPNATEQTYNATETGQYIALITSGGCNSSDTITISTFDNPTVVGIASNNNVCVGEPVTLTGSGANTYLWNNEVIDGIAFVPTATSQYIVVGTDANGCTGSDTITITVKGVQALINPASLSFCAGSAIDSALTVNAADSYQWSLNGSAIPEATAQTLRISTFGTYSVSITSDGCTTTDTVTVGQLAKPNITASASSLEVCSGTAITLTADGANEYVWSHNVTNGVEFTPTESTTFTVIGTNEHGCTDTAQIAILVHSPYTNITSTDPLVWCEGSAISTVLSVEEASEYQWALNGIAIPEATSQSYTATQTGNYSVTIVKASCIARDTVDISTIASASVAISTNDQTSWCPGNNVLITLKATPANAQSYQWKKDGVDIPSAIGSTHITNESGKYVVYAVFGGEGCNATSDTTTLTEHPLPPVDLPNDTIWISTAQSYTLDAGEGSIYLWSDGSTAQTLVVNGATTGIGTFMYKVTVTSEHGCIASDSAVVVVGTVAISPNTWITKIYPNPTSGGFTLNVSGIDGKACTIHIYNVLGQLVRSQTANTENGSINELIDISREPKGIYQIIIQSSRKKQAARVVLN